MILLKSYIILFQRPPFTLFYWARFVFFLCDPCLALSVDFMLCHFHIGPVCFFCFGEVLAKIGSTATDRVHAFIWFPWPIFEPNYVSILPEECTISGMASGVLIPSPYTHICSGMAVTMENRTYLHWPFFQTVPSFFSRAHFLEVWVLRGLWEQAFYLYRRLTIIANQSQHHSRSQSSYLKPGGGSPAVTVTVNPKLSYETSNKNTTKQMQKALGNKPHQNLAFRRYLCKGNSWFSMHKDKFKMRQPNNAPFRTPKTCWLYQFSNKTMKHNSAGQFIYKCNCLYQFTISISLLHSLHY